MQTLYVSFNFKISQFRLKSQIGTLHYHFQLSSIDINSVALYQPHYIFHLDISENEIYHYDVCITSHYPLLVHTILTFTGSSRFTSSVISFIMLSTLSSQHMPFAHHRHSFIYQDINIRIYSSTTILTISSHMANLVLTVKWPVLLLSLTFLAILHLFIAEEQGFNYLFCAKYITIIL